MAFRLIGLSGVTQATAVDGFHRGTARILVQDTLLFQAERRFRPLALRLRITALPSRVDILVKKPCARWCLILLG